MLERSVCNAHLWDNERLCFTAHYPAACTEKPPMRENKIRAAFQKTMCDRAARQRCTIVLRAKRQCAIAPYTKRRCTIGAVRHRRDAKSEPRAADEACTAHANANKF
ncbi:hypothetical protein [uncultured Campylobacter sp.]|uniref:hypothetical protein n=1 Tax=uncultured Campylobacter sp. TaxID=218934 RepID=UPI002611BEBF|nr:hypothetical protein [uncultured Campylobacter sp.]